jgi:hypothetical protein
MSETPRTDEELDHIQNVYHHWVCRPIVKVDEDKCVVDAKFAKQLEIELNEANSIIRQQQLLDEENLSLRQRIKRLEEALEATAKVIGPPNKSTWVTDDELNHAWELYIKSKEAKR